MIPLNLAELVEVTGGELHGCEPAVVVDGVVTTDSRECGPGSLYVARVGEFADGHDCPAAVAAGAVAVLGSRPIAGVPPSRSTTSRPRSNGSAEAWSTGRRARRRDHWLVREDDDEGPAGLRPVDRGRDGGAAELAQRRDRRAPHRVPHPRGDATSSWRWAPGDWSRRVPDPHRPSARRDRPQRRHRARRGVRFPRQHRARQGRSCPRRCQRTACPSSMPTIPSSPRWPAACSRASSSSVSPGAEVRARGRCRRQAGQSGIRPHRPGGARRCRCSSAVPTTWPTHSPWRQRLSSGCRSTALRRHSRRRRR